MKSGIVAIIGRSNVGKSTLINRLIGTKVAITTPKPQTTRKPIQGVLHTPEGQIVFVDTPGIMQKAKDQLTKTLTRFVSDSLQGVDAVLYVADPTREIGNEEKQVLRMAEQITVPKLLLLNKNDDKQFETHKAFYLDLSDQFDEVVEGSAMTGNNLNLVTQWLMDHMPEGDALYPDDSISNLSNEERVAEIIREKLFLRLKQEVPYSTHVEVNTLEYKEDGSLYVDATILTTEERYKGMIIGKGGSGVKEVERSAKRELQTITSQNVHLDLHVEVDARWIERLA